MNDKTNDKTETTDKPGLAKVDAKPAAPELGPEELRAKKLETRAEQRKKEASERSEALKARLRQYVYSGPHSAVTLREGLEVQLSPGATVELPHDSRYVAALIAQGHLTPADEVRAKQARKSAQKGQN